MTGKIKPLLDKIKTVGVPPKVTNAWLKTIGFKSSNDSSLIGVLKIAQLIDSAQTPTPLWQKFRGANGPKELSNGIRTGYAELYAVYPDAHNRSKTDLQYVFSQSSKAGDQAISKAVVTFKNLCAAADFSQSDTGHTPNTEISETAVFQQPVGANVSGQNGRREARPNLHIDVQVHVSADASSEQIDQIFASMAKHLYGT